MIEVEIDASDALRKVGEFGKQLPFAISRALNDVALGFQQDERTGLQRRFTIRRPWVLQGVKMERGDFATKTKLVATVRIDSERDFLSKFEGGDVKTPTRAKGLSVPITGSPAKPTGAALIRTPLRPKNLNLRELGGRHAVQTAAHLSKRSLRGAVGRGAFQVYEGDKKTILIQSRSGAGVLLQRVGRGKRAGLRLLFKLVPRAKQPASLKFHETAYESFRRRWNHVFAERWNEAVRTAR
jgi:hypothetical protein